MAGRKEANSVIDSWAMLAYFEGQEAGLPVKDIIKDASLQQRELLISVVNWGEILYVIETRYTVQKKNEIENLMERMPLKVIEVTKDIAREAARIKAATKLPYADSFAASVASLNQAPLITGDRDFEKVEKIIHIHWL